MEKNEKLYYVYVGGTSENRLIEDHEVVFVVAKNSIDAKILAKKKTKLTIDPHVDVMAEIKNIDGYDILLNKSNFKEEINKVSDYTKL
jgi:hypothetical protein